METSEKTPALRIRALFDSQNTIADNTLRRQESSRFRKGSQFEEKKSIYSKSGPLKLSISLAENSVVDDLSEIQRKAKEEQVDYSVFSC